MFTVLFLAFREPVMAYYSKESPLLSEHYLMLIPLGLATLSYNFFSSWLQAFYKTVVTSFVNEILLRLLISIEISLYALRLITFEQFVVGYVLIYFVPAAILLVYMATIRQTRFRPVPVTPRVRRLLSITAVYGLWQYLGGASMYIVPIVDQTMLAGICGLAEGGIYTTIIYMTSAMQMPYRSIVKVSTPVVTNLWKERDMEGMRKISRDASLMNLIAGCFLFVVIWVNLDNIFSLMPESYASGRYVFLFLGLGWVVNMYVGLNSTILMTSKKYRYEFMLSILLVGLTVLTNALMIPRWGMNGAALGDDDLAAGFQRRARCVRMEVLPDFFTVVARCPRRPVGSRDDRRLDADSAARQFHRRRNDPDDADFARIRYGNLLFEDFSGAEPDARRPASPDFRPPLLTVRRAVGLGDT